MKPDSTGHWASREPVTGLILKGTKHPTFNLTIKGENCKKIEPNHNQSEKWSKSLSLRHSSQYLSYLFPGKNNL